VDEMIQTKSNGYVKLMIAMLLIGVLAMAAHSVLAAQPLLSITLLNQDPNPARAGSAVTLRFQVENPGDSPVTGAQFNIVNEYPFTAVDTSQTIDSIGALQIGNAYANLEFSVKIDPNAKQGTYPIKLKYVDSKDIGLTQEYNVVVINQDYAQIIYLDKSKLSPGRETEINFTINNVGNAPLQNMVFSWDEPKGAILPVYSDNTRYIKYLDVGDSEQLSYTVIADVNAAPGLYQLNMNLKYQSVNNATTSVINSKAGVFIGGDTDFDVAFSESTQGATSLSVANTGNNPASSVSIRIPQQQNFMVSGSNSAIIGNLDKGDYTLVSFQIVSRTADNNASYVARRVQDTTQNVQNFRNTSRNPGMNASQNPNMGGNDLRVIIDYTDTTGARVSVEKNVPINFRTSTTGISTATGSFNRTSTQTSFIGSTLFWIILIVVVLVGGYFIYRKSKNPKKK
jgi:hypothetical protein